MKGVSTNGSIIVNVNGAGSIDPDVGVDLTTVNGALVVNNNNVILGDVTAVKLTATGTGTAAVTNTRTITGGAAPIGNAILGSFAGGAVTINNTVTGVLTGIVNVTGSAASSVFTNAGTWNTYANSANTFTGNFQNSGTTNLASGVTVTVTYLNAVRPRLSVTVTLATTGPVPPYVWLWFGVVTVSSVPSP